MDNKLLKKLQPRHINMIAFGGSIGTGLFLVSGYSIAVAGPGGALLAYLGMAVIVYLLMTNLAEMSSFKPSTGSFCDYSTEFVGKSFGVAMGYNYWLSWASSIAVELAAASQIIGYWFPHVNPIIFNAVFFIAIVIANLFMVKVYGEIEYVLSFVKISAIILFIILGFFSIISTPNFGLHHWTMQGAPFHHGLYGFITVFLFVGLSFQGTELVGVASEETKNPESTIPKAIGMVFWRLTLFYVLSILIITLLIPFNDPNLISQDNVLTSPYTLLFQKYIGRYAADFVNLIILIAVVSAANASLYSSSRILWYLGKSGQAAKTFAGVNQRGVPIIALLSTILISGLFLTASINGNAAFFTYIVQISSLSGFIVWFGIALSHYKFRRNYLPANNISIDTLKYRSKFFPYTTLLSLTIILLVVWGQILSLEAEKRDISTIIITYFSLIIFSAIYIIHKIYTIFRNAKGRLDRIEDPGLS